MVQRTQGGRRRERVALAGGLVVVLAGCLDVAGSVAAAGRRSVSAGEGAIVVAWNELGHRIAYDEDQFLTFRGQRALAMMNLAMHDAVNAVRPAYAPWVYRGHVPAADIGHAAAQAASEVLRSLYPGASAAVDSLLAVSRAHVPPGLYAATRDLGLAAAGAVLDAREADGWDVAGEYQFGTGPGAYQTTPDWNGFVLQPGFRDARPFALGAPDAFRPSPPPALEGDAYARAYDEVKAVGAAGSTVRTADQSAYAVWWMEFAEGSVNRLARRLVRERALDLHEAARLFALLHVALYDTYVATWDSKYEYGHWRPYTAIRAAADDGNDATAADEGWQSLLPAPPFPEYVSAHAAGCAAAFAVLASQWGDGVSFTMSTITAPAGMPERSFRSFGAAAAECADSRVQLGWHFRYSTDAGLALGERVAAEVLRTQLQPI